MIASVRLVFFLALSVALARSAVGGHLHGITSFAIEAYSSGPRYGSPRKVAPSVSTVVGHSSAPNPAGAATGGRGQHLEHAVVELDQVPVRVGYPERAGSPGNSSGGSFTSRSPRSRRNVRASRSSRYPPSCMPTENVVLCSLSPSRSRNSTG